MKLRNIDLSIAAFARFLAVVGVILAVTFLSGLLFTSFFTVNVTPSEPYGLYMYAPGPAGKGDFVQLRKEDCPVKADWIPPTLLKHIRAVSGDQVAVSDDGVYINGIFAGPRPLDPRLKPYSYVGRVPEGQVFLLAPNPRSFDSRHYGAVPLVALRKVVPVWIF